MKYATVLLCGAMLAAAAPQRDLAGAKTSTVQEMDNNGLDNGLDKTEGDSPFEGLAKSHHWDAPNGAEKRKKETDPYDGKINDTKLEFSAYDDMCNKHSVPPEKWDLCLSVYRSCKGEGSFKKIEACGDNKMQAGGLLAHLDVEEPKNETAKSP